MPLFIETLIETAQAWDPGHDGEARKSQELILNLLRHSPEPFARHQFAPGHITATALVFSPARDRILLVHHKRLQRWLLPGGHVESQDTTIFGAAAREAREETAVTLDPVYPPVLASMDVHAIPANTREPYHLHHDLIIAFQAASEHLAVSEESNAVLWCPPQDFESRALAGTIQRAARRGF